MKQKFYLSFLFFAVLLIFSSRSIAQCTNATLDWSSVDYLVTSGNYSSYVSAAAAATQRFAIGTNAVTIATSGATINGENNNHTADPGTDVDFDITSGSITLTFDSEVSNVSFSLYDIDRRQIATIVSKNAANVSVNTTVVKRTGGSSILTLSPASGIGTSVTASSCTGSTCTLSNSSNNGTIDVSVAGPVKTITITITNSGSVGSPDIYLSNITACVTGNFSTGYYAVSRPFTGQASYVLVSLDNSVYYVNRSTGIAKLLFTDPSGNNINSLGYDPYNRFIYYTYSLTASASTDRSIQKYNVNTGVISTLISDVRTLGVILYESGVESGAAAFYNGAFYLGIEGYRANGSASGRESIVWRIDFNGSNVPYQAEQVYGVDADNGSTGTHDWGDIGISNGILYDFDGKVGYSDFIHFNMQTGATTSYTPSPAALVPRQVAVDWEENVYNVGTAAASSEGVISPYNYNGTVNSAAEDTIKNTVNFPLSGSWGDAGEAFRPFCDFGDAPATYDVDPWSPAVNEYDPNLRLGATFDLEWNKTSSALANADGADEDGISTVTILGTAWSTYYVQTSVYNNTGSNATVIGWLDYNGNGIFDASEASASVTVPTSGSLQNIYLFWSGISSPLADGSYTYLRVRVTSAPNGMTSANATGWYDSGETEDYRVPVVFTVLPVNLISFDAKAVDNSKAKLTWSATEEGSFIGYEVQKSKDGVNWEYVSFVQALQNGRGINQYEFIDNNPYKGNSRYRLRLKDNDDAGKYSDIRSVRISDIASMIVIAPNPASNLATISINNEQGGQYAHISVINSSGNRIFYDKKILSAGNNIVNLSVQSWPTGVYIVSVTTNDGTATRKLIVER